MARLGGTGTGLFYRFAGGVLVYSEDDFFLVIRSAPQSLGAAKDKDK